MAELVAQLIEEARGELRDIAKSTLSDEALLGFVNAGRRDLAADHPEVFALDEVVVEYPGDLRLDAEGTKYLDLTDTGRTALFHYCVWRGMVRHGKAAPKKKAGTDHYVLYQEALQ